jgi:hypothetical protein
MSHITITGDLIVGLAVQCTYQYMPIEPTWYPHLFCDVAHHITLTYVTLHHVILWN